MRPDGLVAHAVLVRQDARPGAQVDPPVDHVEQEEQAREEHTGPQAHTGSDLRRIGKVCVTQLFGLNMLFLLL